MDQNRLKSPVVWAAIVAQVLAILTLLSVFNEVVSDALKTVAAGFLELFVLFGVLNNPTDGGAFLEPGRPWLPFTK